MSEKSILEFLSQEQLLKLTDQLSVCEKHCPQSLKCIHGLTVDCPIGAFIEHLSRHTRLCSEPFRKTSLEIPHDTGSIYIDQLKKDLAQPGYNRINTDFRQPFIFHKKNTIFASKHIVR